ncbi:Lipopolysaccharide assembly protein B [uncultured archaeon]|nr:Lipopolysaccharide assembly protein B [uncultured archaeon]
MAEQKYEEAIKTLELSINEKNNDPKIFHLLGLCQLNIAKSTNNKDTYLLALDSFKKALSISPQKIPSLIKCAEILDKLGQEEEGLSYYEQVLSINPEFEFYKGIKSHGQRDPDIILMRKLGYLDDALDRINLLLSKKGYDDDRVRRKIHILDKMDKIEEAIGLIDQILSSSGFDRPLFFLKIQLIRRSWGNQSAIEFLENSISIYHLEEKSILCEIESTARGLINSETADKALQVFEKLSAKGIECSLSIANCLSILGRYEQAIEIYQKYSIQGYNLTIRNLMHCYIKLQRYTDALSLISEYLEKEPTNYEALSSKAYILAIMNHIDDAIHIYETVVSVSTSWNALYQLYRLHYLKQEKIKANNYLQEAILLEPNRDFLWYEKGIISSDLGQIEVAELSFQRSIALNNYFVQSYIGLARILIKKKDWETALEKLNSALEIRPNDPTITKEIGYVAAKKESLQEIDEIRAQYQKELDGKIEQIRYIEEQLSEEKTLSDIVKSLLPGVSENSEKMQNKFIKMYLTETDQLKKSEILDNFCYELWHMLDDRLKERKVEVQIIEYSIKQTVSFSHKLENESICAIATGDFLLRSFKYNPNLDFSPIIIEYCKALECELYTKLFKKIRTHFKIFSSKSLDEVLKNEEKIKNLKSVCKFFKEEKELTLGEIAFILTLVNSDSERSKSILLRVLEDFIQTKTQSPEIFLAKVGFTSRIKEIVDYYRNPAAHVKTLNMDDATACREKVLDCINDFIKSL